MNHSSNSDTFRLLCNVLFSRLDDVESQTEFRHRSTETGLFEIEEGPRAVRHGRTGIVEYIGMVCFVERFFCFFLVLVNLFVCCRRHYVVCGPESTPYEGGFYHGKLVFPREFPFKPPSISMITPNGRFKTNTRLCLSISDFHPDTWNPAWSVSTILTGLLSFMVGFRLNLMYVVLEDLFP